MNKDYNEFLKVFKESLKGESESTLIAASITKHFNEKTHIKILDIGAGDLTEVISLAKYLPSKMLEVDAVDIYEPEIEIPIPNNIIFKRIRIDFMNFDQTNKYDVVYSRQSIYYLGAPEIAIRKMLDLINKTGIVIIVVWDIGCYLRELYKLSTFFDDEFLLSGEEIIKIGKSLNIKTKCVVSNGTIDLSFFNKDVNSLENFKRFILRKDFQVKNPPDDFIKILGSSPRIVNRRNAIIYMTNDE